MGDWASLILDCALIGLVTAGLVQSVRLMRHLAELRQGRADMDRFVKEFNSTVLRAEAGIKGLREAARASGDDLEKLVEKASVLRDELHFIIESADQIASRLTQSASATRPPERQPEAAPEIRGVQSPAETVTPFAAKKGPETAPSRAEKELMQALEKLG